MAKTTRLIPTCIFCGFPIAERAKIGLNTCIDHGDKQAKQEIAEKQMRTGPLFNKGGYQYLGKGDEAKENALSVGRKTASERTEVVSSNYLPIPFVDRVKPVVKRRMQIGVYWTEGTNEAVVLWEGEDIQTKRYARYTMFDTPREFRIGGNRRVAR